MSFLCQIQVRLQLLNSLQFAEVGEELNVFCFFPACVGEVVRGDSVQSDSSGYADEEVSPSLDRHSR